MVRTSISPNFFLDPTISQNVMKEELVINQYKNDLNTKIAIYEDRVNGWFLDVATPLRGMANTGFVILLVSISQIEGMEQFRMGRKTEPSESREVIKNALRRIFDIPSQYEKALNVIVDEVRHGLFHDGMVRKNILISYDAAYPVILEEGSETIIINPSYFLDSLKANFRRYIIQLSDPLNSELRKNFEKRWDELQS